MSGIATIVGQVLGTSHIPASATPLTAPTDPARDARKRDRKAEPKQSRNGRRLVMGAFDRHEARDVHELARIAGVSAGVVYHHLPSLLESGFAVQEKPLGQRAGKRYRRGRG